MLGIGIRSPEDATLLDRPNQTRHIKSQSFKLLMTKSSSLNGRFAKWAILLCQYEIQFLPQKAVKGQAVENFLAEHLDPRTTKLYKDLSDEVTEVCLTQTYFEGQVWQLFFNGASRTGPRGNIVAGVGVVLVPPQNYVIPRAFSLTERCSNM